ncbi:C1 family peptidase [Sunxiuqinia elliptica]|uniref:Bleomycin hydrolase n=1 Tax=Sunxiuqinia elliptica TaxID=655355 RepID=A0A4R6GUE1_9BACT|nr:C1 family peptidase [Sunxiuqinia elliptica]TDN99069.1 bleomycin hydrolase [Sunxiuqinia elliptica]TDO56509.1 bleomycin hydrolase [Sunxiuqinia elliptica]
MNLKYLLTFGATVLVLSSFAQKNESQGKVEVYNQGEGYYYESILKDVNAVNEELEEEAPYIRFNMDQSKLDLPNDPSLYETIWSHSTESQGNAGTCWSFSTTSFYESEIYRQTGKKVELSEIYTVYWEYVEKARRYIEKRGDSKFDEGSEGNAVARIMNRYGVVPEDVYTGLLHNRQFHTHAKMMEEMKGFLESMKASNAWNVNYGLETIKSIMNHYIGEPPVEFTVDGKTYTPKTYMTDYLQLNPNDFVEILSYKQEPYWQQVEYKVPDNWWHSADYYNVPLDVYMEVIKKAIKDGYSMSIGGDVSETGFSRETNCAMIPDYDIPSEYINEDARQFRFSNETTTDDHGMHLIGILENYKGQGKDWYLIKDSSSGSRNVGDQDSRFGYYFFHEDYIKLKMMGFTIHKDAVKDLLKKFK